MFGTLYRNRVGPGHLQREGWPATGRLARVDMVGLTMREILHRNLERTPLLDRLAQGEWKAWRPHSIHLTCAAM